MASGLKAAATNLGGSSGGGGSFSRSKCLRERGNTLYHEAMTETAAAAGIRSSRLQDAIQLYTQAFSLSQSDSDRAMCAKNLGQAFWARSKHRLSMAAAAAGKNSSISSNSQHEFFQSLCFDLLSSVSSFLDALEFSRPPAQPKEWVQGIHWTLVDVAWAVDDLCETSAMSARCRGRFLSELCAVFQQRLPPGVKLQASAIVHKACAQHGLRDATAIAAASAASSRKLLLKDCLFQLSIAQAHTDPSATAFLGEIEAIRSSIAREIDACNVSPRSPPFRPSPAPTSSPPFRPSPTPASSPPFRPSPKSTTSPPFGTSTTSPPFRPTTSPPFRPSPTPASPSSSSSTSQPHFRRNQSYCEDRSQSARSRAGGDLNPPRGCSSFRGSGPQPSDGTRLARSGPSDVERMFSSLPPLEFLRAVYERYPPGRRREREQHHLGNLGSIREVGELKSAYRRAISDYHPDHCGSCPETVRHSDEITKYLIINFNALKDLYTG